MVHRNPDVPHPQNRRGSTWPTKMATTLATPRFAATRLLRRSSIQGSRFGSKERWIRAYSAEDSGSETEELSEADRLRAQEKFMTKGSGDAVCQSCQYKYESSKGDVEYPVSAGTRFEDLPEDWRCPVCAADKSKFKLDSTVIAGFAANQGYGLGTNSMTSSQKNLLIWGSLIFFFALFLAGYAFD